MVKKRIIPNGAKQPSTEKGQSSGNHSAKPEILPVFSEKHLIQNESPDGFDLSQIDVVNPLDGLRKKNDSSANEFPIKVSISLGDLYFANYPLIAGHFEDDGILFAEKNIDKNLNGVLGYRHQMGMYPGPIGSSEVILKTQAAFKGAIIVGLGKPGNLTASELTITVEQGVAKYLLSLWHGNSSKQNISGEPVMTGVSSLIIGCGYAGLSIENSIKAIIQGVYNANCKVRKLKLENTPLIEHLEFIELYEDKAISSLFSISRIEKEVGNSFKIVKERKRIKTLLGYRQRILSEETESWWNRIIVRKEDDDHKAITRLIFKSSTRSSREEEQTLMTTPSLMEKLIKDISTTRQWTPERAKAIFELLIPNDFKDQLKKHGNIIWVLDEYTASYPYELLQDNAKNTKPICITSGMVRQLSTSNYNKTIKTVPKNNILVVADPDLEGFYSQLPGALSEGKKVYEKMEERLKDRGGNVTTSFNDNHTVILEKLYCDDYKIIHLSGHGVFDQENPEQSGMVIGNNQYLSTREIKQMSTVPEVVFVNCCHLGKTDGVIEELYQQRYHLAANIGTQLINNGVTCVIAAGWAVDDRAAERFAVVFYESLFSGDNFGESVLKARKTVYDQFGNTNTWGAYQCYGDPFYRFEDILREPKKDEAPYLIEQQAEVDLVNLYRELEIGDLSSREYLDKLGKISGAVDKADIRNSKITEMEALIYFELKEYKKACIKFEELLEMEEGTFSFAVADKFYNAKAKKIIEDYKEVPKKIDEYLENLDEVIKELNTLISIRPNSEEYNILGSTFKRKAYLLDDQTRKLDAYKQAAFYYQMAYSKHPKWYSLTNWLVIEGILILAQKRRWEDEILCENEKYQLHSLKVALENLELLNKSVFKDLEIKNYWDMIAGINIKLCKYVLNFSGSSAKNDLDKIVEELSVLWEKAGSKGKRFAEIEHLEFILDILSVVKNKDTEKLRTNFKHLKDELEKLV